MIEKTDKDKVSIPVTCSNCGKRVFIKVFPEDLTKFQNGALVQEAFPYLEPEKRELILTGLCPDCWDQNFDED